MICEQLHRVFNGLEIHLFPFDVEDIPKNGIYVLFEEGEKAYGDLRRIVRIGTHTGNDNLPKRLCEHFLKENKDRSIFRKNIGRALLKKRHDPFLEQWEIDLTTKAAKQKYSPQIESKKLAQIEKEVSEVIQKNFSFCVFQVDDRARRLELEERIIATVHRCANCGPSEDWLGNYSPKPKIRESGLWLEQGLNGRTMRLEDLVELEEIKKLDART